MKHLTQTVQFNESTKETFTFSAIVYEEDEQYVSFCLELDISSQGKQLKKLFQT